MHSPMRLRVGRLLVFIAASGCGSESAPEPAPAHLDNPTPEASLTTVHLTPRAAERIGIEVATIERRSVPSRRTFGGELVAPSGAAALLSAPRAATVLPPRGGRLPVAGDRVSAGQDLVHLATLPPDLGRAREEAAAAEAREVNAETKASRARRLVEQGIASRSQLEDAEAEWATARSAADAARARLALMESGTIPEDDSSLSPVVLHAPAAGVVRRVEIAPGQTVSDGAILMEIVKVDPLWIRVPVYGGDRPSVLREPDAVALVHRGADGGVGIAATPIAGPPTADAAAASVDLFYSLPNPEHTFRPGERVSVSVPLVSRSEGLTVPWAAVVIDINGGTWVYVATGEQAYTRTRVEVSEVVEGMAILTRGPAEGSTVVTVGAAELFSTEFGTSH